MQFSDIGNPTVRFGAVIYPTVRFGAVFRNRTMLRCGSVRFSNVVNSTVRFGYILRPTARFGAVFRYRKTYGAVRCGAVRCGFQEGKKPTVRFSYWLTAPNRTKPIGKNAP